MAENIFIGLSIIIGAVLLSLRVMKIFKQPMIIGYIIAGTLISIFLPNLLHDNASFESFASIGVSFLLFMVGMELNPVIIKEMGKSTLIAGFLQVFITSVLGVGIALLLGFDITTSVYIGVGFSFSSTIVVLKLLTDKDEHEGTFGRLSIGILIVQDLIVMILLLLMTSMQSFQTGDGLTVALFLILKIIALGGGLYLISKYIIPITTRKIAESQEYLFLFAIGRCLILGTVFHFLGFSIEIGTLVAGMTLANSSYRFEITSKIRPLRDFFIVIYFVLLGSHVGFGGSNMILPIIIFSIFVLFAKPYIIMLILGLIGHTKKINFLAGTSLGQISEFSFLMITMGMATGAIKDPNVLGTVTIIGLISIAGSSYFISFGDKIYHYCKTWLKIIPGTWKKEYKKINKENFDIVLFGYGRFGGNLYPIISKRYKKILVIDEHPGIISLLQSKKIPCIYGDMSDIDFLEELNLKETKMIISTIRNFDENIILLNTLKKTHKHIIKVLVSNHVQESLKLYELGADYVILPHYIGVDHTSLMIEEFGFDIHKFMENKKNQVHELKGKHSDMMIEMLQKSI
ncbi:cation:proton antiporter [Candidatus Gracilibacteria bacterium]|nr:cation:proton antiporter [Candidatus Gracilibacteria bacterium]